MPEVGGTSSSVVGKILSKFEEDILDHIDTYPRWSAIDGRCYFVDGLSMEGRRKFIPECILEDFKCLDKFSIRAFDCHSSKELIHNSKHFFDRKFKTIGPEDSITLQNDDKCEAFIVGGDSKNNSAELFVAVNDRDQMVAGKKMILTNSSKKSVLPFAKEKGVSFESRLKGKNIWLKPSESVLLEFEIERDRRVWKEVGKSISHNVFFDANPLARQSGPVLQYVENGKSQGVNYEFDGELFLPLNVINRLLQSRVDASNGSFSRFAFTSSDAEIKEFLEVAKTELKEREASVAKKEFMLRCIVYEHLPEHHTLAVAFYIKADKVYCYIHETLGCKSNLGRKIRSKLLQTIQSCFSGYSIICLIPKEAMQKDFSVCGVFAIKFIKYICKNPEEWISLMEEQGVPEKQLETRPIQVEMLPADLLKMCQDEKLASQKQKSYPVVGKKRGARTLEQYWAAYSGRNQRGSKSCAALVKLCKYYSEYIDLKKKAEKRKVKAAGCTQTFVSRTSEKRSLREYDNSLYQPGPKKEKIRDALTGRTIYVEKS
ncbi:hypothetical protein [Endozoicomonas elysicola]|uniref:Uncharacterized protein n=1 Tax=Endozoicomonas elysicola TaxID=305900 RepID=A0A081K6U8_9GAMM|nr:hypothetical protein [Endozoicomonas elysicola]KEI69874.1 hypothetical protein GV64_03160 [Endozoicomonas elysicola]